MIFAYRLISVGTRVTQFGKIYIVTKTGSNVSDNDKSDVLFLQGMGRKTDIAARNSRQLAKGAVILALSGTNFLIT